MEGVKLTIRSKCKNKLGIKSAVSSNEIAALQQISAGKSVIEIGSLLGYSTIQIARVAKHVVSVDPHDGYPYYNPTPTLPEFLHNLDRWGVLGVVTPIIDKAQNAPPHLTGSDVTFIDCTGLYKDTRFCLEQIKSSIIACHDFGRVGCDGVDRAVLEYVKKFNKQLQVVDTLAIIS